MAVERTLSIIKPDAVAKNVIGQIYTRFESNGLKIVASKMKWLSRQEAEAFYAVHKERPFFRRKLLRALFVPMSLKALMQMPSTALTAQKLQLSKLHSSSRK